MSQAVYADYAAATPIDDRVVLAMTEASKFIGNPSSRHSFGRSANEQLTKSRSIISKFLNCQAEEIVFTGSGTESNNLAILGIARANKNKGNHIIATSIEHPSVINSCRALEKDGFNVTYLPVDSNGLVNEDDLLNALTDKTILVTIHLANSEIGVIQDIARFSRITREKSSAYFHTDACQAAAYLDLDVKKLGVDALTFNGTKVYGPKGVAVLFVAQGTDIFPIVYGGGQEKSLRSGTENIPGISGLATAVEIAETERQKNFDHLTVLRNELQNKLEKIQDVTINAKESNRLPNHLSIVVSGSKFSDLVQGMDERGIAVSSGSACSSKTLSDSHVLSAIGLTSEEINKTLRVSLGRSTNQEELEKITSAIEELCK